MHKFDDVDTLQTTLGCDFYIKVYTHAATEERQAEYARDKPEVSELHAQQRIQAAAAIDYLGWFKEYTFLI